MPVMAEVSHRQTCQLLPVAALGKSCGLTDGIVVRIGATTNSLPQSPRSLPLRRRQPPRRTEPPPGAFTVTAALLTLVQLSVGVACAGGVVSAEVAHPMVVSTR